MNETSKALKQLHEVLTVLDNARRTLEVGPRRIEAKKRAAEEKAEAITAAQEEVKRLKVLSDQKNLQLKSNESKIAELKVKLNSITTNREYDALKDQIAADTMANSVLEDEILETLEQIDLAEAAVGAAEADHKSALAEAEQAATDVAKKRPTLEQSVIEAESKLADAEEVIPKTLLADYRRQVQAHGGDALAGVQGGACTGCFRSLSPQVKVELKAGKVQPCGSCGRVLYLDDE